MKKKRRPPRIQPPLTVCQAARDGDCDDKRCPQLKVYHTQCPLWKDEEEA